jgi:alkylation response protein AidB-like acyl-CoA dehydrogenase
MPLISDDQRLMCDNIRRLFAGAGGVARARRVADECPYVDKTVWREFVALGWLSLLLPEDEGGMGGSAADFVILMEAVADLLPPEPIVPALAAAPLLAACESPAANTLLADMLKGECVVLAAAEEPATLLGATTQIVPSAHFADVLVFGADEGGEFSLRALEIDQVGSAISMLRTVAGGAMATFSPEAVRGHLLGKGQAIREAHRRCRNLQRLGTAALLLGISLTSFQKTVDYLKLRRQFGTSIGHFQALQHRAASLHVACQSTRALISEAVRAIATPAENLACAAAKARAADTAMKVAKESVQLHGAIGFSNETDIALFFKHVTTLTACCGSPDACRNDVLAIHG